MKVEIAIKVNDEDLGSLPFSTPIEAKKYLDNFLNSLNDNEFKAETEATE